MRILPYCLSNQLSSIDLYEMRVHFYTVKYILTHKEIIDYPTLCFIYKTNEE